MTPEFDFVSVAALANATARNLAKASITDVELREALHTTKLHNGVRIGSYDILQTTEDDETVFSISTVKNGVLVGGLVFYDTARMIVSMLNNGMSSSSVQINRIVRHNDEFRRARYEIANLEARIEYYEGKGDEFRASLQEDRLGVLRGRNRFLAQELVRRSPAYI